MGQVGRIDIKQLSHPLVRGVASVMVAPYLNTILLFDASLKELHYVALLLQEMSEAIHGERPLLASLSPTASEDDLWGVPIMGESQTIVWSEG